MSKHRAGADRGVPFLRLRMVHACWQAVADVFGFMRSAMGSRIAAPIRSALAHALQWKIRWGDWAAPTLILITPFVNFLRHHDYGLLPSESLLVIAVLAGIGLLAGLALAWRPRLLRPLLLALALVIFVDLQPDLRAPIADVLQRHVPVELSIAQWQVVVVFGCFLPFFALVDALKHRAGIVLTTVFSVMLATTLLLWGDLEWRQLSAEPLPTNAAAGTPRSDLPPIVHVVLDEQIGIEGLPLEMPGAVALRKELIGFYAGHGFRLYGKSFSRYLHTENSLANAMNGESRDRDMSFLAQSGQSFTATENAWFDQLSAQGYRIRVYQTTHLDFCTDRNHRIVACYRSTFNDFSAIRDADIDTSIKFGFIVEVFARRSMLYQMWWVLRNKELDRPAGEARETDIGALQAHPPSLAALLAMPLAERLIDDLRNAEPGDVYFAHLLVPHGGFLLDETCRLKRDPGTWYDHGDRPHGPGERLSGSTRSILYSAYFKQVRCAHLLLGQALEALSEAGVAEEAIVIIHGDHGSRISAVYPSRSNAPRLAPRDVIDGYSTLFAIRAPDLEPGYDERLRSIQALFAELAMGRPIADPVDEVFLARQTRVPGERLVSHPMPHDWQPAE